MRGAVSWRVIDKDMVIAAVGEQGMREGLRTWGCGPAMAPWLFDDGVWAAAPGGKKWMGVYVSVQDGELEVACRCRQRARYCSHGIAVMSYAAANMQSLKARRAAEDAGLLQAVEHARPSQKKKLENVDSSDVDRARAGLHRLKLPPHGLPPRGLDYGRILDMEYMDMSRDCYLKEFRNVDFDKATGIAKLFEASGDIEEAARIHATIVETIAKNTGIVDDSDAYYSTSLQISLKDLIACLVDKGQAREGVPDVARRNHISWLVRRVASNDPDFFTDEFASALDSVCVSKDDVAWRDAEESRLGSPSRRV